MKRTFVDHGMPREWYSTEQGQGIEFLQVCGRSRVLLLLLLTGARSLVRAPQEASQVKNVWVPMGE